ncbi:MAG: hypothetical protein ACOCP8_05165 [archaeon]
MQDFLQFLQYYFSDKPMLFPKLMLAVYFILPLVFLKVYSKLEQ